MINNNGRLQIYQGEDKQTIIRLKQPNGEPLDLTTCTRIEAQLYKSNNKSLLKLSTDQIPASKAYASYSGATFQAMVAGASGNSIILLFDGIKTIQQAVDEWNSSNLGNEVTFTGALGTAVPAQDVIQLSGGIAAYYPIEMLDKKLGYLKIVIMNEETALLRTGEDQSVLFIIDYGPHPTGIRKIARLDKRMDIYKSRPL